MLKLQTRLKMKPDQRIDSMIKALAQNNFLAMDDLEEILLKYGCSEFKPEPIKEIPYDQMDLKSIRIFNRIVGFFNQQRLKFGESAQNVETFFKDICYTQDVKTKQAMKKVTILEAQQFFKKLQDVGIRKSAEVHWPICALLCIDSKYDHLLVP